MTVNLDTILKEDYRRYTAYAQFGCQVVTLLDIALADNKFSVKLIGQLRYDRANHTTRTTPCSPEINYQWQ